MVGLFSPRATWAVLRAGDLRVRLRALRDGQAALRLGMAAAAISTGLLDALADGPATSAELARRMAAADEELLGAWLRTARAGGLVDERDGRWWLTRQGRSLHGDDLVRAQCEAFADFHTGLYRDLRPALAGELRRRDVTEKAEVIARVSAGFEPFVLGELTRIVRDRVPRRVLDVGCGAGVNLAAMVSAGPLVEGVGLDVDAPSVALTGRTLDRWGLTDRARVLQADVRDAARDRPAPLADPFDLALLANVLYYLPPDERVPVLRAVAGLLAPGGRLLVVTTVAEPNLFSRHFDLLLRAQEGQMQLSDGDALVAQLRDAGLADVALHRLVPGQPLVLVEGTRTGSPAG